MIGFEFYWGGFNGIEGMVGQRISKNTFNGTKQNQSLENWILRKVESALIKGNKNKRCVQLLVQKLSHRCTTTDKVSTNFSINHGLHHHQHRHHHHHGQLAMAITSIFIWSCIVVNSIYRVALSLRILSRHARAIGKSVSIIKRKCNSGNIMHIALQCIYNQSFIYSHILLLLVPDRTIYMVE